MAASSRGGRAIQGMLKSPSSLCLRCATTYRQSFRSYSSAAAAVASAQSTSPAATPPITSQKPNSAPVNPVADFDLRAGIILTRAPLVTRELTPFESAFFFYQKRLEERLNSPFITDVFFKSDTARKLDWDIKIAEREGTPAKEIGTYKGKTSKAWDDELRVGDTMSSQEHLMNSLLKDAEARVSDDAEIIPTEDVVPVERPMSRITEADRKGDTTRLDRALDRTLYLVVRGEGEGKWAFPADNLQNENLLEASKRVMNQSAGVNMNTWIIGRVPCAHHIKPPVYEDGALTQRGSKTFFLKGRILAGQADLKDNPFGYKEFQWLTREELQKKLHPAYFKGVKNMMTIR